MCGVVGIVGKHGAKWISRMNNLMINRGPDEGGEYHDRRMEVSLAMRRLNILDAVGGRQPMSNEDETLWIVYNGEIYNAPDLRSTLTAQGCRFRSTHSDTEVLLHLYRERGAKMLDALNGMFAFVIFDKHSRSLFGARDRFGIKPLYYTQQTGNFAFASELKVLLCLPWVNREINRASLFHYMSLLYVPGESSIFNCIKRLPPGCYFTYDLDSFTLKIQNYWDLDISEAEEYTEEEWVERIREELGQAVRRWTLSDVPIGCSLSGGIDSSAIVGLLGERGCKIKTYSLGFSGHDEQPWNELPLARQVAKRWGSDHHELILEPEQLLSDLVKMVWHLDEPYGGGLPSWYVFQFMRQDVIVGLTGTGGDEIFGNYGKASAFENGLIARVGMACRKARSEHTYFADLFTCATRAMVGAVPEQLVGTEMKKRLLNLPSLMQGSIMHYYLNTWYYFSDAAKRETVFQNSYENTLYSTDSLFDQLYAASRTRTIRDGIAYIDVKTQLTDEFLFMTDRFSMAHSLEARVPFLDHIFAQTVFRIPATMRLRGDDPKYLLKKAVADLLPADILNARKRGFVIPITLWLRRQLRPLAEALLNAERLNRQGFFKPEFYNIFVKPHLEGKADHTSQVWAALMFQLWYVVFIEQSMEDEPSFSWRALC